MLTNFLSDPAQLLVTCVDSKDSWVTTVGIPVLSSVLAAAIALIIVFKSARLAEENARRAEERQRVRDTDVLAASLFAEVWSLMHRYQTTVGRLIDEAKKAEELRFGFTAPRFNYFIVFETNASKIGLLDSEEAADGVKFYVLAKGHFEDLITWVSPSRHALDEESQQTMFGIIKKTHVDLLALKGDILGRLGKYSEYVRQQEADWNNAAEREARQL